MAPRDDDVSYRQFFHEVRTGIAVAGADGIFLDANEAFCETVGYTLAELRGLDFLSLTHPDDREHNRANIGELLDGTRTHFLIEKRYLTKDRGPVWVRANVSILYPDPGGTPRFVATTEEITGERAVQARLEQSEALLRIAGAVGRVGGWAIEVDPVRLYWSDEVHDLAGYPRGATPPLDEALELYPPGQREAMTGAVQRCIDQAVPFDLEVAFHPRAGEPRWVRVVGEPLLEPGGAVTRIQGAIIDVTEQRRAQQEKDRLAERLHTTMESITDALYTIDTGWRFTYLNERAVELLERDRHELIGRRIWDAFPTTVGSVLQDAFEQALAQGRTMVVDEYLYAPLERYFAVNIYPSEQGLAVYFRDVTEERRNRVELEERGARLAQQAALLDEAQDAILVRDLEGRISFWNRGAERLCGWSAAEAVGERAQELLAVDPELHEHISRQLLAHGTWFGELVKTTRHGDEMLMQARCTLVNDEAGGPPTVLEICTDITDRKRIERQFLRSQRMETLGRLAGGIAHDLNNALAPVTASIEILRSDETDPAKTRLLEIMESSAKHGVAVIRQLLSFARGVDGEREPLALEEIIEQVRQICADTFPRDVTIRAEVTEDLWAVVGDPTQLQQVLMNLCVNARDAMPTGGTLTLSAENLPADDREPARVVVKVADTGVGIPAEAIDQIFEPFFSTKPRGEGTGLGLSTSAVIVDGHGGNIEVATEPGTGTVFELRLPAAPEPASSDGDGSATLGGGEGELVLVVDDEPAVREVTRMMLERYGYRVVVAVDGSDAVERVRHHLDELAIVITDLMMPVMDGFEAIHEIRRLREDLPIIATTGLNTSDASDRSIRAGADRFLAKPYATEVLLREIAALCRGSVTQLPV
jgi:two-component system, cell cycle sensor histidine kinase and response regulator CckA